MMNFSPRTLAERLSRGRSFWRRLPVEFGHAPLRVSPDSALSFLRWNSKQAFDPMLLRLCDEYVDRDSVVWDVGANIGVFALAAAQRGGKVLAIEPDAWLHSLLCRTQEHRANRDLSLELLCSAIAAEPGTARLMISQRGRSSNFLEQFSGRSQTGGTRATSLVPVLTLDSLLQGGQNPTIVKIDVEGAEVAVLGGAIEVLTSIRPTLLIEVDEDTRGDVIERLSSLHYSLSDYQTGREIVDNTTGSNLLARPN